MDHEEGLSLANGAMIQFAQLGLFSTKTGYRIQNEFAFIFTGTQLSIYTVCNCLLRIAIELATDMKSSSHRLTFQEVDQFQLYGARSPSLTLTYKKRAQHCAKSGKAVEIASSVKSFVPELPDLAKISCCFIGGCKSFKDTTWSVLP